MLLLHKEARLASAHTIDILIISTIAAVKFAVRSYGRSICLLFGPILSISLAKLLFTWQLVTLVLWLNLIRHALCNTTFIKADILLLKASLTWFLSITVQLTELVRFQYQILLFLDSLLQSLTFFETVELVVVFDDLVARSNADLFNIACNFRLDT